MIKKKRGSNYVGESHRIRDGKLLQVQIFFLYTKYIVIQRFTPSFNPLLNTEKKYILIIFFKSIGGVRGMSVKIELLEPENEIELDATDHFLNLKCDNFPLTAAVSNTLTFLT